MNCFDHKFNWSLFLVFINSCNTDNNTEEEKLVWLVIYWKSFASHCEAFFNFKKLNVYYYVLSS